MMREVDKTQRCHGCLEPWGDIFLGYPGPRTCAGAGRPAAGTTASADDRQESKTITAHLPQTLQPWHPPDEQPRLT